MRLCPPSGSPGMGSNGQDPPKSIKVWLPEQKAPKEWHAGQHLIQAALDFDSSLCSTNSYLGPLLSGKRSTILILQIIIMTQNYIVGIYWCLLCMVSSNNPCPHPQRCPNPQKPWICYVNRTGRIEIVNHLTLKLGDHPRWPGWAQCHHKDP